MLKGFGFSGYKSFGGELAKITPLSKINFIIGKNNSGKSNIVSYLSEYFPQLNGKTIVPKQGYKAIDTDKHDSSVKHQCQFAISMNISVDELDDFIESIPIKSNPDHVKNYLRLLLTSDLFVNEEIYSWYLFTSGSLSTAYHAKNDLLGLRPVMDDRAWQGLWMGLSGQTRGSIELHWIPETIQLIAEHAYINPTVEIIPAIREIRDGDDELDDFSGKGLIQKLAKLQNPNRVNLSDKLIFSNINGFVKNVLENDGAEIEIPHDRNEIIVHMDDKSLPLSSLGTGVHEVVILAAAATTLSNILLCIEEPELHLHPHLQRKLITYLAEKTENQYIFTTHSTHLLNFPEASIFHVTYDGKTSRVETTQSDKEKASICHDLGYLSSDIIQSNSIIWVEGPSDRIYIKHWLHEIAPELVEGIHFSIMFFGGRLFSHLSALDEDEVEQNQIEDFIRLRKLNRNAVMIFDSDREKSRAKLNKTKSRLRKEFDKGPGFAWVTSGREIENYIEGDIIENAVKSVHPSATKIVKKDRWSNTLIYNVNKDRKKRTANKVKVARQVVENHPANLGILDLKKQCTKLAQFIRQTNLMT